MNRIEFFNELQMRIQGIPKSEVTRFVDYYNEMLDEFMEEGKTEEEAILSLEPMDHIVNGILEEVPVSDFIKEKVNQVKDEGSNNSKFRRIISLPLWILILPLQFTIVLFVWFLFLSFVSMIVMVGALAIMGVVYSAVLVRHNIMAAVTMIGITLICAGIALKSDRIIGKIFQSSKQFTKNMSNRVKKVFLVG